MTSTLCIHATDKHGRRSIHMSLEDLKTLPVPESLGRCHKPISPFDLISEVKKSVEGQGHEVVRSQFAMNPMKTRLFGVMDFAPNDPALGRAWSMGIISSTDESLRLKLPAGGRVFVCDNLMATGEIVVMRKHTSGFDLQKEIGLMTGKVIEYCKAGDVLIQRQEKIALPEHTAFQIVGDALIQGFMPAGAVREAGQIYAKAEYEDLKSRTLWGLHNAFTRQTQRLAAASQLPATIAIGKFFTKLTDVLDPQVVPEIPAAETPTPVEA
jgi:hypothetical protein